MLGDNRNRRPAPSYHRSTDTDVVEVLSGEKASLEFVPLIAEEDKTGCHLRLHDSLILQRFRLEREISTRDATSLIRKSESESRAVLHRPVESGLVEARRERTDRISTSPPQPTGGWAKRVPTCVNVLRTPSAGTNGVTIRSKIQTHHARRGYRDVPDRSLPSNKSVEESGGKKELRRHGLKNGNIPRCRFKQGGQANALRMLIKGEQERGSDFLRLANALSALYPLGSEEKRLVDSMLLAVPR